MAQSLTFNLNGADVRVSGVSPTQTLLETLREHGHTGTKEGCAEGDCGACTVALRSSEPRRGEVYRAINSCLVPLASVAGQAVVTAEGLAVGGELHPVQTAMARAGGSQCGYCTPGFVMSLFAAFYNGERRGEVLEGNLCRCTGYVPIREALRTLPEPAQDDPFRVPVAPVPATRVPSETAYEGNDQRFFNPTTLGEVFSLLAAYPEAKLIAGGTDLGVEINFGRLFPVLVSLSEVSELADIDLSDSWLELGAGVTLSRLERELAGVFPMLDETLRWFAARQIRNRATIGGNLGTASPVGDLAPVFLALGAEVRLVSAAGERLLPLSAFFTGYRKTALREGEVIACVRLPKAQPADAQRTLCRAYKVGKRGADDISTVAAAFSVVLDALDRVETVRLAYGGVAATPVRAESAERGLVGRPWNAATVSQTAAELRALFSPLSDLRGSAAYRTQLVGNLFEKFFYETQPSTAHVVSR